MNDILCLKWIYLFINQICWYARWRQVWLSNILFTTFTLYMKHDICSIASKIAEYGVLRSGKMTFKIPVTMSFFIFLYFGRIFWNTRDFVLLVCKLINIPGFGNIVMFTPLKTIYISLLYLLHIANERFVLCP